MADTRNLHLKSLKSHHNKLAGFDLHFITGLVVQQCSSTDNGELHPAGGCV